ncbi:retrovirus-related Pol polyprotein from transposon TNT 1-94 [Trichonephila clavata]|uniref:Retrovirus-related Pol polyprotein from transposon TNT 1-94 n=1 Tax=Trichonephila clavata TaxID=2740835 RepID=A0A8X6L5W8_TRICU|nr:retrovirus-related Pol polyprotein from transposon TNT 1-94 [Trichonephila clavata]
MVKYFHSEKEMEDDIVSHIAKLQRNFSELKDDTMRVAKTTLPNLLLMSRIMSTLPSEYFEFKSVWESVPIEERSVNKLTERIRVIEMRLPSKSTDSTALVTNRTKVFKKPERKCYLCRKPGHLAKDCWKKGSKPKVEGDAFVCTVKGVPESELRIHERLCEQNKTHVKDILRKYQIKSDVKDSQIYDGCCYDKQCRRPFGTRKQRATTPGELINIEVCGPMQQQSLGGAKYYICFKDDFTKYCWVFFMQSKTEVSKCIETFLNEAKNAEHMMKGVLSDGGEEVINSTVKSLLEKSGISSSMSMPYTPQQNGAANSENRTIVESARSMICATNLPLKLWAEAVNMSVYMLNRAGPTSVRDKSPYELCFSKEVIDIHHTCMYLEQSALSMYLNKKGRMGQKEC